MRETGRSNVRGDGALGLFLAIALLVTRPMGFSRSSKKWHSRRRNVETYSEPNAVCNQNLTTNAGHHTYPRKPFTKAEPAKRHQQSLYE